MSEKFSNVMILNKISAAKKPYYGDNPTPMNNVR